MRSHSENSDGERHIAGILTKLEEIHRKVMKYETRIWLIRSLTSRDISTRDIYSFVSKQAKIRSHYRVLDKQTVKSATRAKLKDLRLALYENFKNKKHLENILLESLSGRSYIARRKIRQIRGAIYKERKQLRAQYERKIAHYVNKQTKSGNSVDGQQENINKSKGLSMATTIGMNLAKILQSLLPCCAQFVPKTCLDITLR